MNNQSSAMSSMTFRVDPSLQSSFVAACKATDRSAAQVLRAAMRSYLETINQTPPGKAGVS
jgi:predicted transcriptional regulator